MSYLGDLYAYLRGDTQTFAGLVAALSPAVGEINSEIPRFPRVASLTVKWDDLDAQVLNFDQGTVILDAKVWVRFAFDAGTTNELSFATGAADIPGGGSLQQFGYAHDVTIPSGTPVTGYTSVGNDTDPFLPWLVAANTALYVGYSQSGTPATRGQALVWITYLPANGG